MSFTLGLNINHADTSACIFNNFNFSSTSGINYIQTPDNNNTLYSFQPIRLIKYNDYNNHSCITLKIKFYTSRCQYDHDMIDIAHLTKLLNQ